MITSRGLQIVVMAMVALFVTASVISSDPASLGLDDAPAHWKQAVSTYVSPDEFLVAGRSTDGNSECGVVLAVPPNTEMKVISRSLASRSARSLFHEDTAAFPVVTNGSGESVCEKDPKRVLLAIDNLSLKYALMDLPITSMPYDADEMLISSYRDKWYSQVQKWMSLQFREPEEDLYYQVFRDMLTRTPTELKAIQSAANTAYAAIRKVKTASGTAMAVPKNEFISQAWAIYAAQKPAGTQLSALEYARFASVADWIYKVDSGLTKLRWGLLFTRGVVYAAWPSIAIDENCRALEAVLPNLNGTMRRGAERALIEARSARSDWDLRFWNWLRAEGIRETEGLAVSAVLKTLAKKATQETIKEYLTKVGVSSKTAGTGTAIAGATMDVMLGVYISWTGASMLNNLGQIVSEMDKACYAAQVQERMASQVLSHRKSILRAERANQCPDHDELQRAEMAMVLYLSSGTVAFQHISAAFAAQDSSIMDKLARLFKSPDGLAASFRQDAMDAESYARNWCCPANVSQLYRAYWKRIAKTHNGGNTRTPTTTVFVVDCSGSMSTNTPDGVQKLQAAKDAAIHYLDIIGFDANDLGADHEVGVVAFSQSADPVTSPTVTLNDAVDKISALSPLSQTNFGDALDMAITWLEKLPDDRRNGKKLIILLSDGMTNVGPVSRDEFIVDSPEAFTNSLRLYQRAKGEDIGIYTIGFGDPVKAGSMLISNDEGLDEEVLKRIAEVPGTGGEYFTAADAFELDEVYARSFHVATGTLVFETKGTISQNETKQIGPFNPTATNKTARSSRQWSLTIPFLATPVYADDGKADSQMLVTLGWTKGKLGFKLKDPSGRVVDESYPGAHIKQDSQPICVAIDSPQLGNWSAEVTGEEVPDGSTPFHLIASARVPPSTAAVGGGGSVSSTDWQTPLLVSSGVGIFVLGTIGTGIALRRRTPRRSRRTGQCRTPLCWMQVHEPSLSPRNVPIYGSVATIGRARSNAIVLNDPKTSNRHVNVRITGGIAVVTDVGSRNGIKINGQRVESCVLYSGDIFEIGDTIIYFFPADRTS